MFFVSLLKHIRIVMNQANFNLPQADFVGQSRNPIMVPAGMRPIIQQNVQQGSHVPPTIFHSSHANPVIHRIGSGPNVHVLPQQSIMRLGSGPIEGQTPPIITHFQPNMRPPAGGIQFLGSNPVPFIQSKLHGPQSAMSNPVTFPFHHGNNSITTPVVSLGEHSSNALQFSLRHQPPQAAALLPQPPLMMQSLQPSSVYDAPLSHRSNSLISSNNNNQNNNINNNNNNSITNLNFIHHAAALQNPINSASMPINVADHPFAQRPTPVVVNNSNNNIQHSFQRENENILISEDVSTYPSSHNNNPSGLAVSSTSLPPTPVAPLIMKQVPAVAPVSSAANEIGISPVSSVPPSVANPTANQLLLLMPHTSARSATGSNLGTNTNAMIHFQQQQQQQHVYSAMNTSRTSVADASPSPQTNEVVFTVNQTPNVVESSVMFLNQQAPMQSIINSARSTTAANELIPSSARKKSIQSNLLPISINNNITTNSSSAIPRASNSKKSSKSGSNLSNGAVFRSHSSNSANPIKDASSQQQLKSSRSPVPNLGQGKIAVALSVGDATEGAHINTSSHNASPFNSYENGNNIKNEKFNSMSPTQSITQQQQQQHDSHTQNGQVQHDCPACERDARIAARFNALYSDSHFRELRKEKLREAILQKELPLLDSADGRLIHPTEWAKKYDAMLKHRAQIRETLEAERRRREKEKETAELNDCTFKPTISKRPPPNSTMAAVESRRAPLYQNVHRESSVTAGSHLNPTSQNANNNNNNNNSSSRSNRHAMMSSSVGSSSHRTSSNNPPPLLARRSSRPSPARKTSSPSTPASRKRSQQSSTSITSVNKKNNTTTSNSTSGATAVIDPSDVRVRALELLRLVSAQQQPLIAELKSITVSLSESLVLEETKSEEALLLALSENEAEVAQWMEKGNGLQALEERAKLYVDYNPGLDYNRAVEEARNDVFQSNSQHVKDAMTKKLELAMDRLRFEASEKRRMLGEALRDLSDEVAEVCKEFIVNNMQQIAQFVAIPDLTDFPMPSPSEPPNSNLRDLQKVRELSEETVHKHRQVRIRCVVQLAGLAPNLAQEIKNKAKNGNKESWHPPTHQNQNTNGVSQSQKQFSNLDFIPKYFDLLHFQVLSSTTSCMIAACTRLEDSIRPTSLLILNTASSSPPEQPSSVGIKKTGSSKALLQRSSSLNRVTNNNNAGGTSSKIPPTASQGKGGARLIPSGATGGPSRGLVGSSSSSSVNQNPSSAVRSSSLNSRGFTSSSPIKSNSSIVSHANVAVQSRGTKATVNGKVGIGAEASALAAKLALACLSQRSPEGDESGSINLKDGNCLKDIIFDSAGASSTIIL